MYSEQQLTTTREKPRHLWVSGLYKLLWLAKKLLGKERALRICANSAWIFARLGFETAGEVYGQPFHTETQGLSLDFIKRYVSEDSSVIDIGCGTGRWCRALSFAGTVVGIDHDRNSIEKARSFGGNIEYIVGDVTTDLPGQKFDVAFLSHVIEHIENVGEFLLALHEIADKVIVEVPDVESDPLNWVRAKQGCPFYSDGDHVMEYTREIFIDRLERADWKVIECRQERRTIFAVAESAR